MPKESNYICIHGYASPDLGVADLSQGAERDDTSYLCVLQGPLVDFLYNSALINRQHALATVQDVFSQILLTPITLSQPSGTSFDPKMLTYVRSFMCFSTVMTSVLILLRPDAVSR